MVKRRKRPFRALERIEHPEEPKPHPRVLQFSVSLAVVTAVAVTIAPIPAVPLLMSIGAGLVAGVLLSPAIIVTHLAGSAVISVAVREITRRYFGPWTGTEVWQPLAVVFATALLTAVLLHRFLTKRARAGSHIAEALLLSTNVQQPLGTPSTRRELERR